jgi:hypothetical protein
MRGHWGILDERDPGESLEDMNFFCRARRHIETLDNHSVALRRERVAYNIRSKLCLRYDYSGIYSVLVRV